MTLSIILAHPDPRSFNHAIASAVLETLRQYGHSAHFHDLYAEGFDPMLRQEEIPSAAVLPSFIKAHCKEISAAEGIVVIHPNWWGQPPAILKGWIDRVLRPGIGYKFLAGDNGDGIPFGLLKAKAALVFNTSNTPKERELRVFGDPLEALWKRCVFELCGIKTVHRRMFGVVVTSTLSVREEWLAEVRSTVVKHFPRTRTARPRVSKPCRRDR